MNEVCRVCLRPSSDPVHLAYTSYKGTILFIEIFVQCTAVPWNDGLLCRICERRLLDAYEFRRQAQEAEAVWKNCGLIVKNEQKLDVTEVVLQDEYLEDESYQIESLKVLEDPVQIKMEIDEGGNFFHFDDKRRPRKLGRTTQCRFCLKFITEKLGEHEQVHIAMNGGLQCHHCHKKYSSRKRIVEHLRCVHFSNKFDRPRYECDICGKSYTEKSSVRSHKRDVHSDNPRLKKKEVCPLCGKKASHLRKHIDTVHKNLITCYCDMCGKGFKSKAALTNHLKYLHLGIREVQCPICSKFYRNQGEVEMHMKGVHVSEQKFDCKTCGKKFKTEASHRVHVKMHQTDFDFQCDICMARFKTKHYMLAHKKVHSDVKDFQCNVCSASFKRSGQLTKHLRKHTGEFFNCALCPGVGFVDKFSLKEHNERVHIGVRYRCDTCKKTYGSRKHLRQHQKTQMHDLNIWSKLVPTDVVVPYDQD